MKKEKQSLFMAQIKSEKINQEGKGALLIPFAFDMKEVKRNSKKDVHLAIIRDLKKLAPNYTIEEDKPRVSIFKITMNEYKKWLRTGIYEMKAMVGNPYEIMGN